MEGSSFQAVVMQKIPELIVHERIPKVKKWKAEQE